MKDDTLIKFKNNKNTFVSQTLPAVIIVVLC